MDIRVPGTEPPMPQRTGLLIRMDGQEHQATILSISEEKLVALTDVDGHTLRLTPRYKGSTMTSDDTGRDELVCQALWDGVWVDAHAIYRMGAGVAVVSSVDL